MKSRIKQWILRGALVALTVSYTVTSVATQPAQALDVFAGMRCTAVKVFRDTTLTAINVEAKLMEASFNLSLEALELGWKVQDAATEASRKAAIGVFNGLMDIYKNIRANNAEKKAAVNKFKLDALLSYSLFNDDYEAALGSFREDFLAVIRDYRDELRAANTKFKNAVVRIADSALKRCSQFGLLAEVAAKVTVAKVEHLADTTGASVKALGKATQFWTKKNLEILKQVATLLENVYQHKVKMVNVIRGWN